MVKAGALAQARLVLASQEYQLGFPLPRRGALSQGPAGGTSRCRLSENNKPQAQWKVVIGASFLCECLSPYG